MNRITEVSDLELARCELGEKTVIDHFVRRLKGADMLTMTVFSPKPWGVIAHYNQQARRSSPHFTNTDRCPGCADKLPQKQLFYLHGFEIELNRTIFLELTDAACRSIEKQLGMGETMRGLGLHVKRTAADNGRIICRVMNSHKEPAKLPPDCDPHDTLMRLWRIPYRDRRGGKEFPTHRNGFLSAKNRE